MQKDDCSFCTSYEKGLDTIFDENEEVYVAQAKDLKGHDERLVVITKQHTENPPETVQTRAKDFGLAVGREVYGKIPNLEYIAFLSDTKSRFMGHWHRIICDLDPNADDYKQIIEETEFEEYPIRPK